MTAPVAADLAVHNGLVKIAVRDFGGQGPDVLLLHGAGRTLVDWSQVALLLAARHRVVAMDLRNHGWSGDGSWHWPDVVGDVRAVIDALGLTDVTLVGHSLGGMIAALYAVSAGPVRAAVNLDGHGLGRPEQYVGLDPATVADGLARMRALSDSALATAGELDQEQAARAEEAHLHLATALGMSPELAAEAWARGLTNGPDGAVATRPSPVSSSELMTALDSLDLFDIYRRCPCPLLIVNAHAASAGDAPEWVTALLAAYRVGLRRDLAELATGSSHVTVQDLDASHALIVEQPEAVAALVADFIARS